MTSRELVYRTVEFDNPARIPRQIWTLPWAHETFPTEMKRLARDFPNDIEWSPEDLATSTIAEGDPYRIGSYTDAWGARFTQTANGFIGEVKEPIVTDETWQDTTRVHIPRERLTFKPETVNDFCRNTEAFVITPGLARPFEQLQFLRGTENLFIDLCDPPVGLLSFIEEMHSFYCELMETWGKTEVDAIMFLDDWGSQNALLINPTLWRSIFKPLYKDYIEIAHRNGKKAFMHSDGHILAIYPDLVELGLDAINSQLFCMGVEALSMFAGEISFWGEIDRQHLLVDATSADVKDAVYDVYRGLYRSGGCIAQCEVGPGADLRNVRSALEAWDTLLPE
jgi:hypothetical protein